MEYGKDELNSMVEEKGVFEDALVCNHPKVFKMNFSCINDQNKIQFSDIINLQGKSVKNISEKRKRGFNH